jgi:hypothetical protein
MAALSTVKRVARLGWWLGLSVVAMLVAACGAMFTNACRSATPASRDGGGDTTTTKADAPVIALPIPDAAAAESGAATDAGSSDLWNTICE